MIWSRTSAGKSQKPSSHRSRPQLEVLEDRLVPSNIAPAPPGLSEPQQAPAAAVGALNPGVVVVPLRGSLTTQAISAVPTPDPNDDPNLLDIITVGSGQATHLGQFTFRSPHLTNPVKLQVPGGTQILTAANGDTIIGQVAFTQLHFDPASGHIVGSSPVTITGGTGRFEGASGSYVFTVDFDPATLTSTATFDGQLVLARAGG